MLRLVSASMMAVAMLGFAWNAKAQSAGGGAAGGGGTSAGGAPTGGAVAGGGQGGVATPGVQAAPNNPGTALPANNPGVAGANPNVPQGANARAAFNANAAAAASGALPPGAPGANINAFGQAQFGARMNSRANPNGSATADRMRTSVQPNTHNQSVVGAPVAQNVFPVFPNQNPTPLVQNPQLANGAGAPGTVNIPTGQTAAPVPSDQAVAGANVNTGNPMNPTGSTLNPNGVASPTPGRTRITADANIPTADTNLRMRSSVQSNTAIPSAGVVQNVFPGVPNQNPTPIVQNPALANGAGAPGTVNVPTGQTADRAPNDQAFAAANVNTGNQWRFVNQQGQWWYWTPQNNWMYYNGGNWYAY